MDENKLRFGVGVMVIAAIGIAVILTFLFGAFPTLLKDEYVLNVRFPSAEGVGTNTPVLRDGVRVGRVADIQLLPDGGVLLTLRMNEHQKLTHHYIPRIGVGSLITGDAKLEFVRADPNRLAAIHGDDPEIISEPYSDGEYLNYGTKAEDPLATFFSLENELRSTMSSIRNAGQAIEQAGSSVELLVSDVREFMGISTPAAEDGAPSGSPGGLSSGLRPVAFRPAVQPPPADPDAADPDAAVPPRVTVRELTAEAIQTLEEFQGAIRDVRSIVGDPEIRANLERSIQQVPEVLDETRSTLQATQETFRSFERAGREFEQVGQTAQQTVENLNATAQNLEQFTEPLGQRGGELIEQVMTSLANLDNALVQVDAFGRVLNQEDGTLQRLMRDDDVYWQIQRTLENIEKATVRIRPILDDVRVFTDKVARDPRQLGVRGALTKRPSGLGLK